MSISASVVLVSVFESAFKDDSGDGVGWDGLMRGNWEMVVRIWRMCCDARLD